MNSRVAKRLKKWARKAVPMKKDRSKAEAVERAYRNAKRTYKETPWNMRGAILAAMSADQF
jgi:hypothetical protein